jgi:hypothetical protein
MNYIPTIINGTTERTRTPRLISRNKVSVHNLLNAFRETISMKNREVGSPSTKHKIALIGDSSIRGYVHKLKPLLKTNYELYSVMVPLQMN